MARSVKAKEQKPVEIQVVEIVQHDIELFVVGITPFYCNRVAVKAQRELLAPRGRLTQAQKAANQKHDPPEEFRNSPYLRRTNDGPTRIMMKATAFKGAIGQAAIDMPTEVAKAQIDRLTYVTSDYVDIWGIPLLNMDVVRNSDIGHTPDIRTRARIFPWATRLVIRYTTPMLSASSIFTLLAASGKICGVGDFRQQKGKGNNGLYSIHAEPTAQWKSIVASGGMAAQDDALMNIVCSDPESEDLFGWWQEEMKRRARPEEKKPTASRHRKTNGEEEAIVA